MTKDLLNLTVFIPTFNRVDKLQRTLDFFKKSREKFNFNILIGDNNSSDNTNEFLELNHKKYNFQFFSNSENIGITRNIYKGLSKIETEWIWIFGDDDVFHPDIFSIFSSKQKSVEGIIFRSKNFVNFNNDYISKTNSNNIKKLYVDKTNIIDVNMAFGFISSNIIKTKELRVIYSEIMQKEEFTTNNFTVKLASAIYEVKHGFFISDDIFVFQDISNGSHFTKNLERTHKTFILDELEVFIHLKKLKLYYIELYKQNLEARMLRPFFFAKTIGGGGYKNNLRKLISEHKLSFKFFLIAYSPVFILKLALLIYKRIKKGDLPLYVQD